MKSVSLSGTVEYRAQDADAADHDGVGGAGDVPRHRGGGSPPGRGDPAAPPAPQGPGPGGRGAGAEAQLVQAQV